MHIQKTVSRALAGLILLLGISGIWQTEAGAAEAAGAGHVPVAGTLDNATCLTCHDESKGELKVPGSKENSHPLHGINNAKYGKSVHGELQCIACHKEITDSAAPHKIDAAQKPDFVTCHLALWDNAKKENLAKEKERLGVVARNIETYKNSYHAFPREEDKTRANATCDDCHNTHTFNVPPQGTTQRTEWHLTIPNVCGSKCHTDELDEYSTSAHGKKVLLEHNQKAAVCTDCHTSHSIVNTSKMAFKVFSTESCGNCHPANLNSYRSTYHGQVNRLGYGYTSKCYDCHGSHGILGPKDPASTVNPKNLMKTCKKCHKEATQGFLTFSPHATINDYERFPQLWIVWRLMWGLAAAVFAFFWLHTGLWWYREAKERKAHKNHPDSGKDAK
jgi:hypothetical protein